MFEDGYQLGLDIIDTMKRSGLNAIPDGIITVSDALAAGVLSAFHDHNGPRFQKMFASSAWRGHGWRPNAPCR